MTRKSAPLRRYLIGLAWSLLAGPLLALLIAQGVERHLTTKLRAIDPASPITLCQRPAFTQSEKCGAFALAEDAKSLAAAGLAAAAVLPAVYVTVMFALRRRRNALARFFRTIIRTGLAALAVLLIVQGTSVLMASIAMPEAFDTPDAQGTETVVMYSLALLLPLGAGLVSAGIIAIAQWHKLFEVMPLDVGGVILQSGTMPDFAARVTRLASKLGAKPPTRIIVGLNPRAFVTTAQIKLRGGELLAREETLYVPLVAFGAFREPELDALIGHELGHFCGEGLYFSERFGPAFLGLRRSLEAISTPGKRLLAMGRLPAILVVSGMLGVFLRVTGSIRQKREFEADRAAVEVSNGPAVIASVTKLAILGAQWPSFAHGYGVLAHSGVGRRNLVADFLVRTARILEVIDKQKFAQGLQKVQVAHPFDSHPSISQRSTALGVNAEEVISQALEDLMSHTDAPEESRLLEEEVTAIETELARRPGSTLTIDDRAELPAVLDRRSATPAPPVQPLVSAMP
jgi:Zn-dependent protease with chaperone function